MCYNIIKEIPFEAIDSITPLCTQIPLSNVIVWAQLFTVLIIFKKFWSTRSESMPSTLWIFDAKMGNINCSFCERRNMSTLFFLPYCYVTFRMKEKKNLIMSYFKIPNSKRKKQDLKISPTRARSGKPFHILRNSSHGCSFAKLFGWKNNHFKTSL